MQRSKQQFWLWIGVACFLFGLTLYQCRQNGEEQMAAPIGSAWSSTSTSTSVPKLVPLGPGDYLVYVDYTPRSFAELTRDYGRYVDPLFGPNQPWRIHPSCVGISTTTGVRVMRLERSRQFAKPVDAIDEMEKRGYRPALPTELVYFGKAGFQLSPDSEVTALGAIAYAEGERVFPLLSSIGSDGFWLHLLNVSSYAKWAADVSLLFVRKE